VTAIRYHMRREDKEITDPKDLRKILREVKHITIAMARDNEPYLVSLNHGYDEECNCLYFHCASKGKKLEYMRTNDVVWGQALLDFGFGVAADDCHQDFATVIFRGKVSFIEDVEEKRHAFLVTNRHLKAPSEGLKRILDENLERTTVGRVSIEYMTGKKSKEVTI
jgi:nitroimidazol reductase NimA-like FMN-containing flavoprotein (pyridoxamine 5'-phosphate oxidase superfamily)